MRRYFCLQICILSQDLRSLEEQLRRSEAELEEKRIKFEIERQEELDNIDLERFRLQEMEDQERYINKTALHILVQGFKSE